VSFNANLDVDQGHFLITWHRAPLEELTVAQLVNKFPTFFGTRGSLPCSQEPGTGSYPKLDDSRPHLPILLQDPF